MRSIQGLEGEKAVLQTALSSLEEKLKRQQKEHAA